MFLSKNFRLFHNIDDDFLFFRSHPDYLRSPRDAERLLIELSWQKDARFGLRMTWQTFARLAIELKSNKKNFRNRRRKRGVAKNRKKVVGPSWARIQNKIGVNMIITISWRPLWQPLMTFGFHLHLVQAAGGLDYDISLSWWFLPQWALTPALGVRIPQSNLLHKDASCLLIRALPICCTTSD